MSRPPSQASNMVYSAVALLASLLLIIQLPVHFPPTKSTNWLFILWVVLALLNSSINAIVWNDNTINWAPAWCDISSNFIVASRVGIPLSLLCIVRRLYGAVSGKMVYRSANEERRGMLWEMFISIGVPLLLLPLTYIVEGSDFVVLEQEGCYPAVSSTAPAIVLFHVPPAAFSLLSAIYSALNMYIMVRRRNCLREFESNNKLDNYQWRLTLLASAEIGLILPMAMFRLVLDLMPPLSPYSWNQLHSDFSGVFTLSIGDFADDTRNILKFELLNHWMIVGYALIFLAFFGWTERAREHYKRYYAPAFLRLFGYHRQSSSDTREASRKDLEHGSLARGPVFRTFLTSLTTSFGASRITSTQATETYQTAMDEVVAGPEAPASTYCAPTREHDTSPQLPHVETHIPRTQNNDHVSSTSPVSRPKPAFIGHNHP